MLKGLLTSVLLVFFLLAHPPAQGGVQQSAVHGTQDEVPILLYHRFGPTVADGMTVTTGVFASHLEYLTKNGFTIIPLKRLIDFYLRRVQTLPPRAVVIVADDGHKTVYTEMLPLVRKYGIPVTLFIYPSAISNASYAMTWDELRALKQTGLFDIQSHTYWHPNFLKERRKLSPVDFEKFVNVQMKKPLDKIEQELGTRPNMLAWPFGLYDGYLEAKAKEAGYIAAFTIDRRRACRQDGLFALPRYLLTNADQGKRFENILAGKG